VNVKTHALIIKVLAAHGVIALAGTFYLLGVGKTVPVEVLMVATSIVSGLTGHMAPQPNTQEKPTNGETL
jgi:hypothetical protein